MATNMYGYEVANPYGYGETNVDQYSKLGYGETGCCDVVMQNDIDNNHGNDDMSNKYHPYDDLGYGVSNGVGEENPYGYGDDMQIVQPRQRERPRRRGSVTKFSLEAQEVVKATTSVECDGKLEREDSSGMDCDTNADLSDKSTPARTNSSSRKGWGLRSKKH